MKTLYLLPLLLLSCKNEPSAPVSQWDFNGDGKDDNNLTINLNNGKGHTEGNTAPDEWTIVFNNKTLPDLHLKGGEPTPKGMGDLNNDGAAELMIVQQPANGTEFTGGIYTYTDGEWQKLSSELPAIHKGDEKIRRRTYRAPLR